MNSIEDKDNFSDLEKELESQTPIPPLTQWENIWSCCGLQYNYVPTTGEHYLNHWKVAYAYPIGVEFVIISSYLVAIFIHRPNVSFLGPKHVFFLTVFMILFAYSYVAAILVGPGYLPFYYPLRISQGPTRPDYLSGLVTRDDQMEYSKNTVYPNRSRYFNKARRIVIRPDHLCAWLASFVGKKNHKLFFLFNFWGVIYISLFCYSCVRTLFETIFTIGSDTLLFFAIVIFYTILGFSFLCLTGNFLQQNLRQITLNRTQFEIMKNMPALLHRMHPWYKNWEEVFGSISEWYLWLLPIPAFRGIDDYTLATIKFPTDKHI